MSAGERIAHTHGLTAARWQVLGALVLARRPMTVPQVARRMGLTRQSVQVSINYLLDQGLLRRVTNPDHQRSALVMVSERGQATYDQLDRQQADWINELADGMSAAELSAAALVLRQLSDRLDTTQRTEDEE
jgi:DNA-binding MarR family transcriptional regulator